MLDILAPVLVMYCINGIVERTGNICTLDPPNPSVIKYYEPGKSCYVDGIFYTKCEDRLNGTK
jgi:hypothetical protein